MDRSVRAIVNHRLPTVEELNAGCGDWLECCQAYIHAGDCPVSFRAWRVVEQIFDHPCAACATSRCALCEPQQRAHKLIVSEINRPAPPSTQPSAARVVAEEICAYFGDTELAMSGHVNANGVAAIISRHFPSVQPVEEQPLYTQGNREAAIRLLRELREITDPEEIQRQKDSWAQLEAALNPAAATADNEGEPRSVCCNAPVTFAHDGPICEQCKKWTTTKISG